MKTREPIQTDQAPGAIGPYSQAIRYGELVFASGQGGLDPHSGELVSTDVAAQAEQVMQNLQAVLQAAGTGLEHTLKSTIFLRYIKDFAAVNEIYARYVGDPKPARSTVAVSALPMSALVEIEVIAALPPTVQSEPDESGKVLFEEQLEPQKKDRERSKNSKKSKKSKKNKKGKKKK